jgi:hypothetical protein
MTRIAICGGPRTGKTTLAGKLVEDGHRDYDRRLRDATALKHALLLHIPPTVSHTDDLMHLGWSEASDAVARLWLPLPGPWIIEGVALARALRKWRKAHPGEPPPVDRVIRLTTPHVDLTPGQAAMAKGEETVWQEIAGWLLGEDVAMDDGTLDSVAV